jgi:hypothetical protein
LNVPLLPFANSKLLKLYRAYAIIGGMPEIVKQYIEYKDLLALAPIYDSLITSYLDDVEKKFFRIKEIENDVEHLKCKICEFENAQPGMIALETAYAAIQTATGSDLTPERWVQLAAYNPRKIFGMESPVLDVNHSANITLFDPNIAFTFTESHIQSKSKNSPFIGKKMTGKVIGTILNQHLHIN